MSDESAQRQRRSLCLSTKDYDDNEKWSRYVKPNMIITTLSILSLVLMIGSTAVVILYVQTQRLLVPCPKRWVKYEEKCYYFSEIDGSWDSSQRNCSSYGASLVSIDTQQEMDFLMRFKGSAYYWIGLQRKAVGEPWKWTNGSIFNGWSNRESVKQSFAEASGSSQGTQARKPVRAMGGHVHKVAATLRSTSAVLKNKLSCHTKWLHLALSLPPMNEPHLSPT
ncbi:C-type lectin domain family 2 member D-like [Paroedura picta]|uniref:C-type lectin domain family 2 member D-like n=1 Tax=Paroedura picta TaxID=143630 RepID=UPI0040568226